MEDLTAFPESTVRTYENYLEASDGKWPDWCPQCKSKVFVEEQNVHENCAWDETKAYYKTATPGTLCCSNGNVILPKNKFPPELQHLYDRTKPKGRVTIFFSNKKIIFFSFSSKIRELSIIAAVLLPSASITNLAIKLLQKRVGHGAWLFKEEFIIILGH